MSYDRPMSISPRNWLSGKDGFAKIPHFLQFRRRSKRAAPFGVHLHRNTQVADIQNLQPVSLKSWSLRQARGGSLDASAQELFQNAIHLPNRFVSGEMTLDGFLRRVAQIENQLDRLLDEEVANVAARKLQTRFSTHRDKLLTFLSYPEVPPTNNESERALRPSVIHRKVTNGFRSEWGAKTYAALQSVIATAKLKVSLFLIFSCG
ncbi:MAG: transposase [Acidobacteria bacterium]|nr:transposase [Acidobacteriota bacterium]MCW5968339.1 transposase [Blastocatellales bacterium]